MGISIVRDVCSYFINLGGVIWFCWGAHGKITGHRDLTQQSIIAWPSRCLLVPFVELLLQSDATSMGNFDSDDHARLSLLLLDRRQFWQSDWTEGTW